MIVPTVKKAFICLSKSKSFSCSSIVKMGAIRKDLNLFSSLAVWSPLFFKKRGGPILTEKLDSASQNPVTQLGFKLLVVFMRLELLS
jgi:hypothetical protein